MASTEVYLINLLGAASFAGGAYLAVKYVLPVVQGFLVDVVKYKRTVDSFVKLLAIVVYLAAARGIVERVGAIGDTLPGYISAAASRLWG